MPDPREPEPAAPAVSAAPVGPAATASALRVLVRRLDRRLRAEAGFDDLPAPQLAALRRLSDAAPDGLTASELARLEGVRPQSMSATVADLIAAGLVDRRADPADGRASRLTLSGRSEELIVAARDAKDGWLARTLAERLDDAERHRVAEAVELLERLLEP